MTARRKPANVERALARRFSPMAQFRLSRGLKQTDVANRGDLHESTVSKLEIGARPATPSQVRAMARGLRTTLARTRDLLSDTRYWAWCASGKKIVKVGRS